MAPLVLQQGTVTSPCSSYSQELLCDQGRGVPSPSPAQPSEEGRSAGSRSDLWGGQCLPRAPGVPAQGGRKKISAACVQNGAGQTGRPLGLQLSVRDQASGRKEGQPWLRLR